MARTIRLEVLNPAQTLLATDRAQWVRLRLADGTRLSIYPGHAPLLAETVAAPLRYADGDGEHVFRAGAGILRVRGDRVTVFTSHESATEGEPETLAVSVERRFERLARELTAKLEREEDGGLGDVLVTDHEQA